MNSQYSASYIIPFRYESDARLANLLAVLRWVEQLPKTEIIVVEQAKESVLTDKLGSAVQHIFKQHGGSFNKARALNAGADAANGEVLILADADMIIQVDALRMSIEVCESHIEALSPYQYLIDLDLSESKDFIRDQTLPTAKHEKLSARQQAGEQLCFCGGVFVIRKSVYQAICGMDEAFQGWGGEDDAMSIKLAKLGVSQLVKKEQFAYHLWHARDQQQRYQQSDYKDNVALLLRYQNMTPSELRSYLGMSE